MDSTNLLRRLGSQAQDEADPQLDVRGSVLHSLHRRQTSSVPQNLAVVALAACSLAAVAAGVIYLPIPEGDSVAYLSQVVMQSAGPEALLQLVEP